MYKCMQMYEFSTRSFVHRFQKLLCWHLFTDLFHKDLCLLVRINCYYFSQLLSAMPCKYKKNFNLYQTSEKYPYDTSVEINGENYLLNFMCISDCLCIILLVRYVNIWKSERERERERESFLVCSACMCNSYHDNFDAWALTDV